MRTTPLVSAQVTAARECLDAAHPLRRFLVPFSFQTITVNDNARCNLINPRSMGPRNFAFTDEGTRLAWSAAPALIVGGVEFAGTVPPMQLLTMVLDREAYIDYLKSTGVDTPSRAARGTRVADAASAVDGAT